MSLDSCRAFVPVVVIDHGPPQLCAADLLHQLNFPAPACHATWKALTTNVSYPSSHLLDQNHTAHPPGRNRRGHSVANHEMSLEWLKDFRWTRPNPRTAVEL